MGIEQIKLGCRVHEQLINSAVALAPTPNFRDLTLTDIANAYGITQEEAHKCFANVDELVDAVREFLSGIFYKNVPVPTASDFPGAVTELIISYTRCARSNPQLFRAMYSLMPAEPELSHDNPNPVLAMAMRVVNHFYPEASEWVRLTRSIAIFSCMHGYTHLCTFGSLRHLSTPAKDHVAAALARHVIVGIGDSLSTGRALRVAPFDFYEHIPAESFPAAKDMPKTTEEERFIALHRGAIEVIAYQDPSALTVEAAAARSGVKLKEARAMLDPEIPEPQQLEKYLDEWGARLFSRYMSDLDQAAPVASRGKANAFGYAACALADPLGFDAYVEVASSSVVTTSFEENDCYFEQARCFQLMIQIIRETIRDGGGTDSPWVLFENSLVMWCFAHGIAHGLTKASLRFFPEQLKRELIGPIFDISLSSLMRRLGLNLDGFIELSVVRSTC